MSGHSKATFAVCTCILLASGPARLRSQDASQAVVDSSRAPGALPAPGSLEQIRRYLESSRGSLETPEELAPFLERLHQISTESREVAAHILHFGDSHTAGDEWTAPLRSLLQQRFGRGGSGFSLAGRPFAGY